MRRISAVLLALCLFLTAISLCACGENGGDTSSTEDGALIKITNDSGTVLGFERKYHNDHGDLTRIDYYNADEVYDHYIIFEYDDEYRLIKETTYKADGIGDHYYSYEYDDNGTLREKGYYTMSEGAERTLFNESGYASERYTYDKSDTIIKYEVMSDGKWVEAPIPEEKTEVADTAQAEAE